MRQRSFQGSLRLLPAKELAPITERADAALTSRHSRFRAKFRMSASVMENDGVTRERKPTRAIRRVVDAIGIACDTGRDTYGSTCSHNGFFSKMTYEQMTTCGKRWPSERSLLDNPSGGKRLNAVSCRAGTALSAV